MDRYLGGEEIDEKVLTTDLERAVARATFFPVVPVCSVSGVGCAEPALPERGKSGVGTAVAGE